MASWANRMTSQWFVSTCMLAGGLIVGALGASSGSATSMGPVPKGAVSSSVPLVKASSTGGLPSANGATAAPGSAKGLLGKAKATEAQIQTETWESDFAWGVHHSKLIVDASESETGAWIFDKEGSLAAVPRKMLQAEQLLRSGVAQAIPAKKQTEKRAEEALRLYYHAKWLAERNLAKAAEWRYRESSRLAKEAKRSVLAAHSLSRLGYFLMHWRRQEEAREVLQVSEKLNTKANPLGPYLYGLLERQVSGADVKRLHAAEERIIGSGKQPSEDLEIQRLDLIDDIHYWRSVQASPRRCMDTFNTAHILICLCSHAASAVQQAFLQ